MYEKKYYRVKGFEHLWSEDLRQGENTSIGKPVAVFDIQKKQQYWLVPLLLKSKVKGFAIFDLAGRL